MSPADQQATLSTLRKRLDDGEVERDLMQGGEVLDDACMRRWLRADGWDVDRAEQRLRDHAKWRTAMAPNGCIEEVPDASLEDSMHDQQGGPCACDSELPATAF
jgi:hypothetical protein